MPIALSLEIGRPIDLTHRGATLSLRRDGEGERVRVFGSGFALNGEPLDGDRLVWITPSFEVTITHEGEACLVQAVSGHGIHRYAFTCARSWDISRRGPRSEPPRTRGKGRRKAG